MHTSKFLRKVCMLNVCRVLALVGVFASCGFVSAQSPEKSWDRTIPSKEREILLKLYQATDGDHWKRRDGWGGPVGTECHWYGISCSSKSPSEQQSATPEEWYKTSLTVVFISLYENGLNGKIPDEIAQLADLESFDIYKNHLTEMPNT